MNRQRTCKRYLGSAALFAALILLGGLLWPVASPAAAAADQPPNLAGTWKLNKDKSDNPRQKMQEAMGNSQGAQGGGGGQSRGGGQGGPGGRGGGMMNDFSQLTIVQSGSDIKVTGSSGRTLAVLPADTSSNSDANSSADSNADSNANGQYAPPASHCALAGQSTHRRDAKPAWQNDAHLRAFFRWQTALRDNAHGEPALQSAGNVPPFL